MQNTFELHKDLLDNYPFIFKDATDFPPIRDLSEYVKFFERQSKKDLYLFPIRSLMKLDILKELKDTIYNSFHVVDPANGNPLITYFQFDSSHHAMGMYFIDQKLDRYGVGINLYTSDHQFPLDFYGKYKSYLIEEKPTGFGFGSKM